MKLRVLQVGLGPIGLAVVKQLVTRRGFELVGAVDIDPQKQGRDVGALAGIERPLRIEVTSNLGRAIRAGRPDVAVLCTASSLEAALPLMEDVVRRRVPLVTTAEEAAYPSRRNRRLAERLDTLARKAGVAVLGTGVNPGFVMDALPIALSAACERVDRVDVWRVQDARIRRRPFQAKVGAGMTPADFQRGVDEGVVRHVGFTESIQMIADALGWRLDRITDSVAPKLATARVASEFFSVERGQVAGLVQDGVGYVRGERRITLRLEAYLGAPESYDAVTIEGVPRLHSRIDGGLHGDIATASVTVNALPAIVAAPPGLRSMRDMRLPSFYGGR
jgi:4-hydroxy-tetrahydrodipicolinate reductase